MKRDFNRALARVLMGVCGGVSAWPAMASGATDEAVVLPQIVVQGGEDGALTSPDAQQARAQIQRTPGAVELIDAQTWRDTPARTIKDILGHSAGVFAQPKWGEDTRLSIRGSGLSRNSHLRGIQLLVDGIPLNAADGSADFQEIDPSAYRYVEVYKGANALRYGANSLGGAINFVTPTGYDAPTLSGRIDGGSFGYGRAQAAVAGRAGAADGYLSAAYLSNDGYRDHSEGQSQRYFGNIGYRFTPGLETRFYVFGADLDQRIPGAVTRDAALHDPRTAAAANQRLDYQRNMRTLRLANKTQLKLDDVTLEAGVVADEKQLIHPIFQYLEYEYHDRGGFARLLVDGEFAGHDHHFVLGATLFDGYVNNQQFQNQPGAQRGALVSASRDASDNLVSYAENSLSLAQSLSLIAGLQYVDAERRRQDRRTDDAADTSGRADYSFWSPKLGLLWQATPQAQLFGNLSRSGELPTFGELNFTNAALAGTRAQRATTLEIGTRGAVGELSWDVALYRAQIEYEFQYYDLGGGNYAVTNADDTIHQGLELAGSWHFARDLLGGDALKFSVAYTYSDFVFDDDAQWGDNDLPGAPHQYLRAEWLYQQIGGFYSGPTLEWVPQSYFVDNANTTRTQAYALLGWRAGYDDARGWSVYVEARNLADRRYIASTSATGVASSASALYEPGEGVAVSAGVSARW